MKEALATYANADASVVINVMNDISYEITRNGWTSHTDMSKWYIKAESVIRHIENDLTAGYYPGVVRREA